MQVIEHILNTRAPKFSYELLPPNRGAGISKIIEAVAQLKYYNPAWINVTSHASSLIAISTPNGISTQKVIKKRPGTISVCGIIQNKFAIDAVAHILCQGFSKDETENALIDLSYLGIENILALRGDNLNYDKQLGANKEINHYASELVTQVAQINQGDFLHQTNYFPINFCIGVAGYPETHSLSTDFDTDIFYLKQKIEAGAQYIITQMFFDNAKFYAFVARCHYHGISVPIIPGLKLIKTVKQLEVLPQVFSIQLPHTLVNEITRYNAHVVEIGKKWLDFQVRDLIAHGFNNIHFFLMNDVSSVLEVVSKY